MGMIIWKGKAKKQKNTSTEKYLISFLSNHGPQFLGQSTYLSFLICHASWKELALIVSRCTPLNPDKRSVFCYAYWEKNNISSSNEIIASFPSKTQLSVHKHISDYIKASLTNNNPEIILNCEPLFHDASNLWKSKRKLTRKHQASTHIYLPQSVILSPPFHQVNKSWFRFSIIKMQKL